jgi:hypothetical protein
VGNKYIFEDNRVIFLTGGAHAHCLKFFDYYCKIYFRYGSKVFEKTSRSYLFKVSKTTTQAISDCENDEVGEFAVRKLFNCHESDLNVNYHVLFLALLTNEVIREHPVRNCNY